MLQSMLLDMYIFYIKNHFLSIQGGITFFAVRRYREGFEDTFAQRSSYDDQTQSSPYSSFPGSETGDPYQQPPFSGTQKEPTDFQQPTY